MGIIGSNAATELDLSEGVVMGTTGREDDGTGGQGIVMRDGAHATVTRASLVGNRHIGIFVFGFKAALAAERSWPLAEPWTKRARSTNAHRAERLSNGVEFRDNGLDLDTSELAVPEMEPGL